MTPEERWERIERQNEFLLQQQAKFFNALHDNEGQIGRNSEQIARNNEQIARNGEQIARNSGHIGQLTDVVFKLVDVVDHVNRHVDSQIERLALSQKTTDERLNILIDVVERYFSDGDRTS